MQSFVLDTNVQIEKKVRNIGEALKRKEAEQIGAVTYKSTKPCKRGHTGERYTKGSACVECVALIRGLTLNRRNRSLSNNALALQAKERGEVTYVPDKPCKSGHSLRFVESNNCVECDELQREKHKIAKRYARINKIYGLEKNDYLNLVAEQNSSCKLCNKVAEDHFNLHVDHCHDTGKVRGLLCGTCNQGIGLLKHSPELLRLAAEYCK